MRNIDSGKFDSRDSNRGLSETAVADNAVVAMAVIAAAILAGVKGKPQGGKAEAE